MKNEDLPPENDDENAASVPGNEDCEKLPNEENDPAKTQVYNPEQIRLSITMAKKQADQEQLSPAQFNQLCLLMARAFWLAFNNINTYGLNHPLSNKAISDCQHHLDVILKQVPQASLILKQGNLHCENSHFSLGVGMQRLSERFLNLSIDGITFSRGIASEELRHFFPLLANSKLFPTLQDIQAASKSQHIHFNLAEKFSQPKPTPPSENGQQTKSTERPADAIGERKTADIIENKASQATVKETPYPIETTETGIQSGQKTTAPQNRPWLWISISLAVIAVFLYFFLAAPHGRELTTEATGSEETTVSTAQLKPPAETSVSTRAFTEHELSDQALWGSAPLIDSDNEFIISSQDDARLAAIMQALEKQASLFLQTRTSTRRDQTISVTSGNFAGFNMNIIATSDAAAKPPEIEINVITPGKGVLKSSNQKLISVKNTDPEKFTAELNSAGFEIIRDPGGAQPGMIFIRLARNTFSSVNSDFLVTGQAAGRLQLGTEVARIGSFFPPGAVVAGNRYREGGRFQIIHKVYDSSQHELLFAFEKDGRVAGIRLISERYRTERGIGLKSTLGQVLAAYGRIRFIQTNAREPFAALPGLEAQIYFENNKIDFSTRDFPLDARIVTLLIGEIPILADN